MAGDIFYSSVDKNLRSELNARAAAGFSSRDYKQIDFMLSKITNVQVSAYKGPLLVPNELVEDNVTGGNHRFAILGGSQTRRESYRPSSTGTDGGFKGGYLTKDRLANRIPPVITLAEINIGDHSMALLNKATFNVLISDPSADLNEFESIWFKPGRNVEIRYEGSKDQIITYKTNKDGEVTNGLLTPPSGSRYKLLTEKYGSKAADKEYQFRKMNEITFAGIITSFTFSYLPDGTVEATIMMSGTSNIFTDVSLMLPDNEDEPAGETNTFYKYVKDQVDSHIKNIDESKFLNLEIKTDKTRNDLNILIGSLYQEKPKPLNSVGPTQPVDLQNQYKYISLGLLIKYINDKLIAKLNNVPKTESTESKPVPLTIDAKIICNEEICLGNVYPYLTSADPKKILLWKGTTQGSNVSSYPDKDIEIAPSQADIDAAEEAEEDTPPTIDYFPIELMQDVIAETPGFQSGKKTYPSRIYIGLDTVIKPLLNNDKITTVNMLLKQISSIIASNTGGLIKMALITDPAVPDMLLYYNTNYVGNEENIKEIGVNPYLIPMSSKSSLESIPNENKSVIGSIVTDAKISSKLPDNMKSLAFVLNEGSDISKSQISPFVTYMYADGSADEPNTQRGRIAKNYTKKHLEVMKELREAKALLSNDFLDNPSIGRLRDILYKYNQYPTKSIKDTNTLNAPVFIFDAEITIEGIQGFRIGDVVQLPVLPTRYRTQAVFSVIGITHNVDSAGVWRTKLKLVMRAKTQ